MNQHDLVVVNSRPDATLYRVVSVSGFRAEIVDHALSMERPGKIAPQQIDVSLLRTPTPEQLENYRD